PALTPNQPKTTLFPYTTLFRSEKGKNQNHMSDEDVSKILETYRNRETVDKYSYVATREEIEENEYNLNIPRYVDTFEEEEPVDRSEEHTSELQSRFDLVCRLLL